MARVVWAPKALDDLENLLAYIANDAPAAARRFAQKVIARVALLADHPLLGAHLPEDDTRIYREGRQGRYRVVYRVDGETVYVVAVHHAARLLYADDLE